MIEYVHLTSARNCRQFLGEGRIESKCVSMYVLELKGGLGAQPPAAGKVPFFRQKVPFLK